jgi:integrase/recombinase XerD
VPEALLTPEELRGLFEAAENPRDRAFIMMDYDGGFRIGEILSLKIVNLTFDKYSAVVRVDGKTGPRRVRLTISSPALAHWLSLHPFRNDPEAPLWIGIGTVGRNKPLSYDGARALLRRLARKIGLKKRVYSHLMRHTRATELAKIMTDAQLREYFGWVSGSDMPGNYVHLSGRDVDGVLLEAHGIKVAKEDKKEVALTLAECPRCRNQITLDTQFCPHCGIVLSDKAAVSLEEERKEADRLMDMLFKDDEVRAFFSKKVMELFGSSQPGLS